jgi:predicted N-formylglutamate amidohydrolase
LGIGDQSADRCVFVRKKIHTRTEREQKKEYAKDTSALQVHSFTPMFDNEKRKLLG